MAGYEDGTSIRVSCIKRGTTNSGIWCFFAEELESLYYFKNSYVRSVQYPLGSDESQAIVTFSTPEVARFYSGRSIYMESFFIKRHTVFCKQISASSQLPTTTSVTTSRPTRPLLYSTVVSRNNASSPAAHPGSAVPVTKPLSTVRGSSDHFTPASTLQAVNTGSNVRNSSSSNRGRCDTTTTGTHRQQLNPTELAKKTSRPMETSPETPRSASPTQGDDDGCGDWTILNAPKEQSLERDEGRPTRGSYRQRSFASGNKPFRSDPKALERDTLECLLLLRAKSLKRIETRYGITRSGASQDAETVDLTAEYDVDSSHQAIQEIMSVYEAMMKSFGSTGSSRKGCTPEAEALALDTFTAMYCNVFVAQRPSGHFILYGKDEKLVNEALRVFEKLLEANRRRGRHSYGSRGNDRSTGYKTHEHDSLSTATDDDPEAGGCTPNGSVDRESELQAESPSFPALQDDWPVFDNVAKASESPRQSPEPASPPKETETRRDDQSAWKAHEDNAWYTSLTSSETVAAGSLSTDSSEERASEGPSGIQLLGGNLSSSVNKTKQLEGHGKGTLTLIFSYPSDVQNSMSEHSGRPYTVEPFIAYLPYSHEGNRLMKLLKKAFESEKLFRVSEQPLSGKLKLDPIGVDLKTETVGKYGYPDKTYLDRLRAQLGELGFSDPDPDALAHAENTEQSVHPPQPEGGKLCRSVYKKSDLHGFESKGTNVLKFGFEAGKHEVRPGVFREYSAAVFVAYLPNCISGKELANLLADAFRDQKLFRVVDGNLDPRAVLKSEKSGPNGYPDNTYLDQLENQLRGLGYNVSQTGVDQLEEAVGALVLDSAQADKRPPPSLNI